MCNRVILFFSILFISFSSFADFNFAAFPRQHHFVGLDLYSGPTAVTGGFSEQKNPNSFGFSLNVFLQSLNDVPFPSFMSIGNYNFSMVSNDASYPFPVGHEVNFSTNFFNLMVSIYSTHNLGLYAGVGYSIISLLDDEDKKFAQRYGSEQYEVQARYFINDRWGAHYKMKWQQINQFHNGNFSFIEMWSHFFGVSYVLF